jgi:hypothetical protein
MSIKTAVTIGLVGTALATALQVGFIVGEDFMMSMYERHAGLFKILNLSWPLSLLIFFIVLRINQK